MKDSPFDRVRPRTPATPAPARSGADAEGKRALFSDQPSLPQPGLITIECAGCGQLSSLGVVAAARAAFPSLHLPPLRGHRHSSYLRCPACHRWQWVRLGVRF